MIRLLFPIVEEVCRIIYPDLDQKSAGIKLLGDLGIKYPNLIWDMFRDALTHSDRPRYASYLGKNINWQASFGETPSSQREKRRVDLNVKNFYESLANRLDKEIRLSSNESIEIQVGYQYLSENLPAELKVEIEELLNE